MVLRVLVVDDTILFRRIVSEAAAAVPRVEVVGSASDGKVALAKIRALKPDIITLDLDMPEMNGLELMEAIHREKIDVGVILVSSLTLQGGELTLRGLHLGAFDFITKPEGGSPQENLNAIKDALAPRFNAFMAVKEYRDRSSLAPAPPPASHTVKRPAAPTLRPEPTVSVPAESREQKGTAAVAIGISTGGPKALGTLISQLPGNLGVPFFIVQHMPPLFTASLAESLNNRSAMRVKEAENSEAIAPDTVYIAPGGRQMKVVSAGEERTKKICITDDPPENNCRPAVDYLFRSIAEQYKSRATGVIMTGMGNDGAKGVLLMKHGGAHIIAQDEASCVVFGMPRAAIASGAVDVVSPLENIAQEIVSSLRFYVTED